MMVVTFQQGSTSCVGGVFDCTLFFSSLDYYLCCMVSGMHTGYFIDGFYIGII